MLRRALGAQAENLQFVGDVLILQSLGGVVNPLFKPRNLDFDGPPAFAAHDVMMVMLVRAFAVEGLTIDVDYVELALRGHHLQIAVGGGRADARAALAQDIGDFLRRGESGQFRQNLGDEESGPRHTPGGRGLLDTHDVLPLSGNK